MKSFLSFSAASSALLRSDSARSAFTSAVTSTKVSKAAPSRSDCAVQSRIMSSLRSRRRVKPTLNSLSPVTKPLSSCQASSDSYKGLHRAINASKRGFSLSDSRSRRHNAAKAGLQKLNRPSGPKTATPSRSVSRVSFCIRLRALNLVSSS